GRRSPKGRRAPSRPTSGSLRPTSVASALLLAGFGAFAALLAWRSLPWPLIHDVALMHYAAWRIADGAVPYRDLFDMNQPGTYLVHLAVLRTLGGSDLAWRVFDLAWLVATACVIAATAAAPLAVLGWLAAVGGLAAWYQIVSGYLVPLYSRLGRASSWSVYRWHAWIPLGLGVLVSLASVTRRRGVSARHVVAALGLAYGLAHYVVQGKGWEYHLYPLAAFAAVLVAAELPSALAARRRLVAGALAA